METLNLLCLNHRFLNGGRSKWGRINTTNVNPVAAASRRYFVAITNVTVMVTEWQIAWQNTTDIDRYGMKVSQNYHKVTFEHGPRLALSYSQDGEHLTFLIFLEMSVMPGRTEKCWSSKWPSWIFQGWDFQVIDVKKVIGHFQTVLPIIFGPSSIWYKAPPNWAVEAYWFSVCLLEFHNYWV